MSVRIGGAAAILGGALLFVGFAWSAWDPADTDPGMLVILVSFVALLVGLVGLSAFQAREHPALVWAAFVVPALGLLVAIVGLLGMAGDSDRVLAGISSWGLFMLGGLATLVGSMLFAYATYRTRVLPRTGSLLLAFGVIAAIAMGVANALVWPGPGILAPIAILAVSIGWIALGWSGVRVGSPAPAMTA
jgi:hypothetical protein